jgi:hypothetical protein
MRTDVQPGVKPEWFSLANDGRIIAFTAVPEFSKSMPMSRCTTISMHQPRSLGKPILCSGFGTCSWCELFDLGDLGRWQARE